MLRPQGCKRVEHNLVTKQQQNSKSSFVNILFFPFLKIFICEPFLKPFLNLLEYFFSVAFFGHDACGILISPSGIQPAPPSLEGKVLTTGPSLSGFSALPTSLEARNAKATATGTSRF